MTVLTQDQTQELSEIFRLLGDPTRLGITLAVAGAPRPVGEVAESLGLSSSLVSHHLRLLRAARVVLAKKSASNGAGAV